MKAILEFDLPEDEPAYKNAVMAQDYYSVLWQLAQQFRQWEKYDCKDVVEIELLRTTFYDLLDNYNIEL